MIEDLKKTFILAFVFVSLLTTNVLAEHEIDHRYNIRGYVLDKNQQGISKQPVRVFKGSSLLVSGNTDSAGYYSLHLHLHNEDNRQILRLHAGTNVAELRVTFDAEDLNTLRVHEANFVAGEFIEGRLSRFRVPPWIYPLGGLLALGLIAVFLEKRRKKKIRLKKFGTSEKPKSSSHKSKKRRRKKH